MRSTHGGRRWLDVMLSAPLSPSSRLPLCSRRSSHFQAAPLFARSPFLEPRLAKWWSGAATMSTRFTEAAPLSSIREYEYCAGCVRYFTQPLKRPVHSISLLCPVSVFAPFRVPSLRGECGLDSVAVQKAGSGSDGEWSASARCDLGRTAPRTRSSWAA